MLSLLRRLFFIFGFLVLLSPSLFGEEILVTENQSRKNIGNFFEYVESDSSDLSLTEVLKPETIWGKNSLEYISFPGRKNAVWLRTKFTHTGVFAHNFYLRFSSPVMDRFSLYIKAKDAWIKVESGEQVLSKDKAIFSHIPSFPILLNPGETKEIYLRLESANPIFSFVDFNNTKDYLTFSKKVDIFFGAYFGAGLFLFLYTLFLTVSLNYKQFYYFFFHLFSVLLLNLYATGFMQYFEIGDSNIWKNYFFPTTVFLAGSSGMLFLDKFLELEKVSPKLQKALFGMLGFLVLFFAFHFFLPNRIGIRISLIAGLLPLLFGFIVSLFVLLKNPKNSESYFLLLAYVSFLLGALLNSLTIQGFLPAIRLANISLPLGSAIEIFLMAAALMVRVYQLRKDKEETAELESQLKLAEKIQKGLLPKYKSNAKGFSLGFRFVPTSNVGGDFLQVLEDQSGIGLFICDVSGHGIPAAMIASMAKVSLQIWADNLSEPAKSAEKIRLSLLENLSGHFLSAFFVYIDPKKKILKYANAGHHPLALVSRKGEITWLTAKGRAITEYLELNLEEKEIPLPTSGSLVLYTDGVLEARNPENNQLLGEEKFTELLVEYAGLDAQTLCDRIMGEVFKFQKYKKADDDVTILAMSFERTLEKETQTQTPAQKGKRGGGKGKPKKSGK